MIVAAAEGVTFTAPCPGCGRDCTWTQTFRTNYPSFGPVEVEQSTSIGCTCPVERAA